MQYAREWCYRLEAFVTIKSIFGHLQNSWAQSCIEYWPGIPYLFVLAFRRVHNRGVWWRWWAIGVFVCVGRRDSISLCVGDTQGSQQWDVVVVNWWEYLCVGRRCEVNAHFDAYMVYATWLLCMRGPRGREWKWCSQAWRTWSQHNTVTRFGDLFCIVMLVQR